MNQNQQWQAACQARAALYRWFSELFARELSTTTLNAWQHSDAYISIHQAFTDLGLNVPSSRVIHAIDALQPSSADSALELAADFAQLFLLSGRDSAPPYASYYLDGKQHLYGKPAAQMRHFLNDHQLTLHPDFREPDDHLSVYLSVMSLWNKSSDDSLDAGDQAAFLNDALMPWLAKFSTRCATIKVQSDLYPALTELLLAYIKQDLALLNDISTG